MNAPITETEGILLRAAERGRARKLPYAGEVTPAEAHRLAIAPGAHVIDVRSRFEHEYIGRVPASTLIEWKSWPDGEFNPHFLADLRRQYGADDIILFLCRSGIRSHAAAITAAEAGFSRAFNIVEGFEGDLDENGQRGRLGGWRKAGLPWVQS